MRTRTGINFGLSRQNTNVICLSVFLAVLLLLPLVCCCGDLRRKLIKSIYIAQSVASFICLLKKKKHIHLFETNKICILLRKFCSTTNYISNRQLCENVILCVCLCARKMIFVSPSIFISFLLDLA